MNDFLTLAIAGGLTYGISRACAKVAPSNKARSPKRARGATIPRMPVDVQNTAIAPRKQRAPRHSASGPFGMTQEQFKQARRNSFKWSVGDEAPEWDGTNNGWANDESIAEETAGTCDDCKQNGIAWATPRDNGTCYECGAPLPESINPEGEQD